MKYEIPREVFKQRLEDKLNFALVDVHSQVVVAFEGSTHMPYGPNFVSSFETKYPAKNQNVLLYSLNSSDESPAKAADELAQAGYQFVYFYRGSDKDIVLDKGLN
ncbi:MAG: hypothetical protein ACLGG7_04360 [Bacteriovoracia bacterium]